MATRAGRVWIVALVALLALAGCSSGGDDEQAPAKPDLPSLSDAMVITESDFPPLPGGKFKSTAVRGLPTAKGKIDRCDMDSWFAGGRPAGGCGAHQRRHQSRLRRGALPHSSPGGSSGVGG